MSDPEEAAAYLGELEVELSARGMRCELVTTGYMPRLRLYIPWIFTEGWAADCAFEDHILATNEVAERWQFWWPWIEPIGPVDDLTGSADRILRDTLETLAVTLEYVANDQQDEPGAQGGATGQAPGAGCRHGACQSCAFLRSLTGQLEALGLNVHANIYPTAPKDSNGGIDEIEITNPASSQRGTVRVTNDGLMTWKMGEEPIRLHGASEMASVITATLKAGPDSAKEGLSR